MKHTTKPENKEESSWTGEDPVLFLFPKIARPKKGQMLFVGLEYNEELQEYQMVSHYYAPLPSSDIEDVEEAKTRQHLLFG